MAVKNIQANAVTTKVQDGALFVDIREKSETDRLKYDVPNVVYLPLSEFDKKFMAILPADKTTSIILACLSGGRSMMAASFLDKNGYQNVFNLEGGISSWSAQGFPTKGM